MMSPNISADCNLKNRCHPQRHIYTVWEHVQNLKQKVNNHLYIHEDVAPFLISVHAEFSYQTATVLLFGLFPLYCESTALAALFSFLLITRLLKLNRF